MIRKDTGDILQAEKRKFENEFLQTIDVHDFARQEQVWIRHNLDFIYSARPEHVNLSINPYCKFIESDATIEGRLCKETYILLPKFLTTNRLVVHAGFVAQADKMIKLMANYKGRFTLAEITDVLLGNCDPLKQAALERNLHTLIRKFLSYQYLVIN